MDSSQDRQPEDVKKPWWGHWPRSLAGAFGGSALAALVWSIVDLVSASTDSTDTFVLWAMTAAGCALLLVITLPPTLVFIAGGRFVERRMVATGPGSEQPSFALMVVSVALGLAAGSLLVFFTHRIVGGAFASKEARAVALALVAPIVVFGLPLATRWAVVWTCRKVGWQPRKLVYQRLFLYLGTPIVGLLWYLVLRLKAQTFFEALEYSWVLAVGSVVLVGGVSGMLAHRFRFRAWWLTLPAVPLLVLAGAHPFLSLGNDVKGAVLVQKKTTLSHIPLRWAYGTGEAAKTFTKREAKFGTCDPAIEPPKKGDAGKAPPDAPNIVLLTVDAFRWDRTTFGGYKRPTTPLLAQLAKTAASFQRAHVPATSTRQTLRSLFTGLPPGLVEAPKGRDWALTFAEDQATVAAYLYESGYHTVALSSDNRIFTYKDRALKGFKILDESFVKKHMKHKPTVTDKLNKVKQLLKKGHRKPLFIWSHIFELHHPYVHGKVKKRFGKSKSDRFDTALTYMDQELHKFMSFVLEQPYAKRTIFIITSDHGESFNEHGHYFHGKALYQEAVHVPWLVWGPGVKPGKYDELRSLVDLTPTILGLAGVKVPPGLCGRDLSDGLKTGKMPEAGPIYLEVIPDSTRKFFVIALIDGYDKLLYHPNEQSIELYDLKKDPTEKTNLADDNPLKVTYMLRLIRELFAKRGVDPKAYQLP